MRKDTMPDGDDANGGDDTATFFACAQCGAKMTYAPGSASVKCGYCDHENPIPESWDEIQELDFHEYLKKTTDQAVTEERITVRCTGCGAESTSEENVTSMHCPFCGLDFVGTATSSRAIKPGSLLPFKIDRKEAHTRFKQWVSKLWFAPTPLKKMSHSDTGLSGMYVPYWTYDADTDTVYRGQRGDYYYETETYSTTENGKQVTKTRQVRKTRWTNVSGRVSRSFDDVLVMASESLPHKYADKLEPWDLENLAAYNDAYLSGFRAESYRIDLEKGFTVARKKMDDQIVMDIKRDIGGDEQRILNSKTRHSNITFKHILLPIWLNAYRFKEKSYRFLVNGRTGEVQGERPWDWFKIGITVGGAVAVIMALVLLLG